MERDRKRKVFRGASQIRGESIAGIATSHGTEQDQHGFAGLVAILESKVGAARSTISPLESKCATASLRGGPYPSTSDGRSTSVGSYSIVRFTRLLCYEGFPDSALPEELKDANSLGIWHVVN